MDKHIQITTVLSLRKWRSDDLSELVKQANHADIASNLTNMFPHPYTTEAGEKFIKYSNSEGSNEIFCIAINDKPAGGIGLHPQEDIFAANAELGYWLGHEYWGEGIMTQSVTAACRWGFDNLNINRIFARPFGTNIGSQKVLQKCGFALEARLVGTIIKNGRVEDELIYGLRQSQ